MIIFVTVILLFIIYRRLSKEVPILMYHRIANIPNDRNTVSPDMFTEQLRYLQKQGYTTISLEDLYDHLTTKMPLPSKPVILTFDDGYEDNFTNALPLLKEYGMIATVCVISNWVGKNNDWENYRGKPHCSTMSWEQLQEWQRQGMEICAHTVNHPFLSRLTTDEIRNELSHCKKDLEERLGIPIDFLCYPYGDLDARVTSITKSLGYKGALAIFKDAPFWHTDLFALKRVVISSRQPLWEFALKVSSIHMLFVGLRIFEYRIKKFFR